ncbi:MAG: KpsF/GutQ family sugar-phosphate isomerase [Candidatus Omnitrophica bacterium]|nr:KpsF/GutQ family sugar-phosphate isomerase [Candidatus Omnitrophota bacterium]
MNIRKEIKRVIAVQAASLFELTKHIGPDYEKAVNVIHHSRGKVVVTGIGKSGLIAQKIASTFSSIGTPAIFLHPSEGVHGNLGLIDKKDVVIAIGKSGESEELLAILPFIQKIGAQIICITANKKSTLARHSKVILLTPMRREVCPLNLAPTTSSTMALVVGDALAISLMKLRNFSPEMFAMYHPGGLIGKKLFLKVKDIMRGGAHNPVVSIKDSLAKLLIEITRKGAGAVSVVDG